MKQRFFGGKPNSQSWLVWKIRMIRFGMDSSEKDALSRDVCNVTGILFSVKSLLYPHDGSYISKIPVHSHRGDISGYHRYSDRNGESCISLLKKNIYIYIYDDDSPFQEISPWNLHHIILYIYIYSLYPIYSWFTHVMAYNGIVYMGKY